MEEAQSVIPEWESLSLIDDQTPSMFGKEHDAVLRSQEKLRKFIKNWVRSAENLLEK